MRILKAVRLGIHKKGHGNVARGAQLWIGERPAARKSFFLPSSCLPSLMIVCSKKVDGESKTSHQFTSR